MKIRCLWPFALVLAHSLLAQDHTLVFSTSAPGVTRAITNWGLDTCWPSFDNMQRGLIYMGTNNVNLIRVGFFVDAPLTNNDVTPADKANLQTCANLAAMATGASRWDMNLDSSVDAWYQSGANTVYPDRWAAAIQACQQYYNRSIWMVEGFNEPDYTSNNEGSAQNLYDIFGYLQASTNFPNTLMAGGSTLNDDVALSWFNPIAARASVGTTHCLAGSAANYVNLIQTVTASNAMAFNPELHNVCEAIIGANHGLKGGIWWGTAEVARGSFVKACQGQRLGYAEDLGKWTAAAVYLGPNGALQAFLGGSERMATTTSYRFFARDRDVFYDGYGPQRDYTVTVPGGTGYWVNQPNAERVVNISWGADVQPAINGRYIIVNRNSGKVLEVPGATMNNGIILDQATYTGGLNQQWDVNPLPGTVGGDFSYFTIKAAHSGVTADESNYSYANGSPIQQWNGGTNLVEQWYLEYAGNNYFRIRNRWSWKVAGVFGASTSSGAQVVQWDSNGSPDQQWRLIPATVPTYDFIAPAAPTGLTVAANAVSVQLSWNTNTEADLASYTVLRGTNSGGPYDIVARGLTNSAFTDKSANQPATFFYVVKAVDRSLNISGNSAQVSATPGCGPTLVAHYALDGSLTDSSGNANDGTSTGSPTFVGGKYGLALNLNGSSQYAMLPANMLASVSNFTIAVWLKWGGGNAWQRVFDFGNDTTQYMFLTPGSGSGTLRFALSTNGNAPGAEQILETVPPPVGQWQHIAITRNGNVARLYTNGVIAVFGTVTIPPAIFNPVLNFLGASQYSTDPFLNGQLDELYVYNYALSGTEIARLMANQPPPPTVPTTMSFSASGNSLRLFWPSNYLGSRLESNAVGVAASGLWFTVSGSASTNEMSLPINNTCSNVFYRLAYP
jgi:hypothetical protein